MDDCSHYPRHGYWELHSLSLMTDISGQHKTLSPRGWWEHQTEGSSQQLWSFSSEELSRVRHLPQTGLLNKLTLEGPNPTLVPSVWRIQHLYVSLSYMCTCTMCFCWVLKDYLSHGGFFCHVLFCYFRSPFKIKQATLPHISPREETKKAQQMLVIVQMLVCLMYFWKYSGTWAMSRAQTQNRTCGLKSTSFSAAP